MENHHFGQQAETLGDELYKRFQKTMEYYHAINGMNSLCKMGTLEIYHFLTGNLTSFRLGHLQEQTVTVITRGYPLLDIGNWKINMFDKWISYGHVQ